MSKESTPTNLEPYIWVNTSTALADLVATLAKTPIIAVDTESDSLHSYFTKVCLLQFSTPEVDYLVDPLTVDIAPLGPIFASESVQKVFHAAEYDIISLKRDYQFTFANLFDTMLAARVLGWSQCGLQALLAQHFEVMLNKQFQRYNWGQRPLSPEALTYARLDTRYLLDLRRVQIEALEQRNRLREAHAAFKRVVRVEPTFKAFDPNDFWRVKGVRSVPPREQAIVRRLFILRDALAQKLDRPPFKVMHDSVLLRLAEVQPSQLADLTAIKGLGARLVKHHGADILNAITQGQADPTPRYQRKTNKKRPDPKTLARYETLRQWRNTLASERGVEPDMIINNDALMGIARRNPSSSQGLKKLGILGEWQLETYGQILLSVLESSQ